MLWAWRSRSTSTKWGTWQCCGGWGSADAPLFIPGVGALVMLREHVTNPVTAARIGLAGPVWGLGAAVASWITYQATGASIWLAITELTAFLNLLRGLPEPWASGHSSGH